jgi:hypothetical protein
MNYDAVMVRETSDDFLAMTLADAMQSITGVEVISIVCNGKRWHVFAKFDSSIVDLDNVDTAIERSHGKTN